MEQKLLLIFAVFLLIPGVIAEEISIDFPEEISFNEEFEIKLSLVDFKQDLYDIKIDLIDSSGKRIAQIYDGTKFKSTYYYINDVIEPGEEEKFILKVIEKYEGKASLIISVRDSKEKVNRFSGYELEVLGVSEEQEEQEEKTGEEQEEQASAEKNDNVIDKQLSNNSKQESATQQSVTEKNKIIKLNPTNSNIYKSREEYIKQYAIYGFTALLALIVVLLILKKLK